MCIFPDKRILPMSQKKENIYIFSDKQFSHSYGFYSACWWKLIIHSFVNLIMHRSIQQNNHNVFYFVCCSQIALFFFFLADSFWFWKHYTPSDCPGGSDGKASAYSEGDPDSIPGSGRSPEKGNGNPLQYSCWKIPWTEEPDGYNPWGRRVEHRWATSLHFTYTPQISTNGKICF